jgi:hypothetical protein
MTNENKDYQVHFMIKASMNVPSESEGKALKRFWEKEVHSIIKSMNSNGRVNKEDLVIEAKEIVASEENNEKKKIFISR